MFFTQEKFSKEKENLKEEGSETKFSYQGAP